MTTGVKILSNNQLAASPHYEKILTEYNLRFARDGRVNAGRFHQEVILPLLPDYSVHAWYGFLRRFKVLGNVQEGIAGVISGVVEANKPPLPGAVIQEKVMLGNTAATSKLIQSLLNISAQRAEELMLKPELLKHSEAIKLGLAAMKAQDSRIHAVGKLREDNREQEKFDRAFADAASG